MEYYSKQISQLISELSTLPGIGAKSAQRLAFHILDMPVEVSQRLLSGRYHGDESKKDIHESNVGFLRACRESALYTAQRCGWRIITCSDGTAPLTIEEISLKIRQEIEGI